LLRTAFLLAAMPAAVPEVAGCKVCNLRGRRCQSDSRDHVCHNKLTHWGHRDERALTWSSSQCYVCDNSCWADAADEQQHERTCSRQVQDDIAEILIRRRNASCLAPAHDIRRQSEPLPGGRVRRRVQQGRRVQHAPAALRDKLPQPGRKGLWCRFRFRTHKPRRHLNTSTATTRGRVPDCSRCASILAGYNIAAARSSKAQCATSRVLPASLDMLSVIAGRPRRVRAAA